MLPLLPAAKVNVTDCAPALHVYRLRVACLESNRICGSRLDFKLGLDQRGRAYNYRWEVLYRRLRLLSVYDSVIPPIFHLLGRPPLRLWFKAPWRLRSNTVRTAGRRYFAESLGPSHSGESGLLPYKLPITRLVAGRYYVTRTHG